MNTGPTTTAWVTCLPCIGSGLLIAPQTRRCPHCRGCGQICVRVADLRAEEKYL